MNGRVFFTGVRPATVGEMSEVWFRAVSADGAECRGVSDGGGGGRWLSQEWCCAVRAFFYIRGLVFFENAAVEFAFAVRVSIARFAPIYCFFLFCVRFCYTGLCAPLSPPR